MHELVPFGAGDGRGAPSCAVSATAARERETLALGFVLEAPPGALRVPRRSDAPERRDGLWRTTCFEAFVAPSGDAAYWEVNVAPSGDWHVYRFTGYRTGMAPETRLSTLASTLETRVDRLVLRAALELGAIPELASGPLDVGLAAVVEHGDGTLQYFALRHAGAQPDFHRRDGMVLRVA